MHYEEACLSCRSGIKSGKKDVQKIIDRHKEWAMTRLSQVDLKLDYLKECKPFLKDEIGRLEEEKWRLLKALERYPKCKGGEK